MPNEQLEKKLWEKLAADHVDIYDFSREHAGHMGADPDQTFGTHLRVLVVSPQFEGVSLLDRHRMIHQVLAEDFTKKLHALEIKTYASSEWQPDTPQA